MKAKTEELLYFLLWASTPFFRPTFHNVTDSFEGWAYRRGLLPRLQELQKQQWLEERAVGKDKRLYRLTEAGWLRAQGGRDPEARWKRRWDGYWRLVLFDIPEADRRMRRKLRLLLRSRGFGYLQRSVWVTPDPLLEEDLAIAGVTPEVESLLLLEASPCAGEKDRQIVLGSWDFEQINEAYKAHRHILERQPRQRIDSEPKARALQSWIQAEHTAWCNVMLLDPLLPEVLLPPGYAGRNSWRARLDVMAEFGERIRGSS